MGKGEGRAIGSGRLSGRLHVVVALPIVGLEGLVEHGRGEGARLAALRVSGWQREALKLVKGIAIVLLLSEGYSSVPTLPTCPSNLPDSPVG